jgi:hypothetical protein
LGWPATKKLEGILQAALKLSPHEQRRAWEEVEKELTCDICGWQGNHNREAPGDFAGLLENLPRWVERAHLHFMRHMFWNRFPYSRWFTPQLSAAEKESYFGRRDWLKKINVEHHMGVPHSCDLPRQSRERSQISKSHPRSF